MAMRAGSCSYRYDALDRLATRVAPDPVSTRRFYCEGRLASELNAGRHRRFVRGERYLLVQHDAAAETRQSTLLLTDQAASVLSFLAADDLPMHIAYSCYGFPNNKAVLPGLPGFNGEHLDAMTGHYPLGNGYRSYNPVLMRFNGPDNQSPFGEGGLNAYAYCQGDPVNHRDPRGHARERTQLILNLMTVVAVFTAIVASLMARPAIRATFKGTADLSQKLMAGSALVQLGAGALMPAARTATLVAPDSTIAEALYWGVFITTVVPTSARGVVALKPGPARWWRPKIVSPVNRKEQAIARLSNAEGVAVIRRHSV